MINIDTMTKRNSHIIPWLIQIHVVSFPSYMNFFHITGEFFAWDYSSHVTSWTLDFGTVVQYMTLPCQTKWSLPVKPIYWDCDVKHMSSFLANFMPLKVDFWIYMIFNFVRKAAGGVRVPVILAWWSRCIFTCNSAKQTMNSWNLWVARFMDYM